MTSSNVWTVDDARQLYHVDGWGDGFFDINERGEVVMTAGRLPTSQGIVLNELVERIKADGVQLPVLVRFEEILKQRVRRLCEAFDDARRSVYFSGQYTAIYPIKVNQQRSVLEQILAHGGERVGLEAGSKPELLAVLAMIPEGGTIVCNGYKDREYIRLALIAQMLGARVFIVVEKPSELAHVFSVAEEMGVDPRLGVRVRLASVGKGNWQNSGGEKGKFGLTTRQLLQFVDELELKGKLHWLQLLHFHMGSQLSDIEDIRRGVREAGQFLKTLNDRGVVLKVFDVGGGLGVDYEGLHSRHEHSINYDLPDYADAVVRTLNEVCVKSGLPAMEIFTEAGRAMTAHHAVLISDVIDVERSRIDHSAEPLFADLLEASKTLGPKKALEEAEVWLQQIYDRFCDQEIGLEERSKWEVAFKAFCADLAQLHGTDDVAFEIEQRLADKVFLNFSLFQSIPDAWGLGQVFPVLPLDGLAKAPSKQVVIEDLTCDSDGRIGTFAHSGGIHATLPMPAFDSIEDTPLMGIFLVGAYQEILGDVHNLFGDTHSVNVRNQGDDYILVEEETGDTVTELLGFVHLDAEMLLRQCRRKMVNQALSNEQKRNVTGVLSGVLAGYSYFNHER